MLQPLGVVPVVRNSSHDALDSQFPVASYVPHDASPFHSGFKESFIDNYSMHHYRPPHLFRQLFPCPSVHIRFRYKIYGKQFTTTFPFGDFGGGTDEAVTLCP